MLSFLYRIYKSKKYIYVYSRNKSAIVIYSFCLQPSPNHNLYPTLQSILSGIKGSIYSEPGWETSIKLHIFTAPTAIPAGRPLKEDGMGCYCSGLKVRQMWWTDEHEWVTWKDKCMSALILLLLWVTYPCKVWSLKKTNKKKKTESICLSVPLISAGQKFREREFSVMSSWLKECKLLTSCGKDSGSLLLGDKSRSCFSFGAN